jgi:hypothetical protein
MSALLNGTTTAPTATGAATNSVAILASYLDTCPTCQGWNGTDIQAADLTFSSSTCPTCGQASLEWDMLLEIDAILTDLNAFGALDQAVRDLI